MTSHAERRRRSPRRTTLVVAAIAVTAVPTVWGVLGRDDDGGSDPASEPAREPVGAGRPTELADLRWDESALLAGALDTCGGVAVMSDEEHPLQVVLPAENRVVLPQVTAPAGSGLDVGSDWTTRGGCVPTEEGPVVVVEAQEAYAEPSPPGPKILAGFTPDGTQLWSRSLPAHAYGSYDGRGAFVVERGGSGRWEVVDARTGRSVATGGPGDDHQPTVPLTPQLVGDEAGGLVRYPEGRSVGTFATAIAQVDDDRMIVSGVQGLELLRIADLGRLWLRRDLAPSVVWDEVADLSTNTAVLFDFRGRIHGIDLETGQDRWIADVPREKVNGVELQAGSGVIAFWTSGGDGQVVLDSRTGERLRPDGYVVADQDLLLLVQDGVPRSVTVADLR